jgi:hypothetical protein
MKPALIGRDRETQHSLKKLNEIGLWKMPGMLQGCEAFPNHIVFDPQPEITPLDEVIGGLWDPGTVEDFHQEESEEAKIRYCNGSKPRSTGHDPVKAQELPIDW